MDEPTIRKAVEMLGGPTATARLLGVTTPAVHQWMSGIRMVPPDRCPDIERATGGKVLADELRGDVRWARVEDESWPHVDGRPCLDVAAPTQEAA